MPRSGLQLLIAVAMLVLLQPQVAAAQEQPDAAEMPSIIESITADSLNIIVQPSELDERTEFHKPEERKRKVDGRAGFRVQIFSDGNQSTARNSARARIRQVTSRFPQYRTYLDYKSPYWRARVGDFKTREEANEVAAQLRRAFPAFSKEVRVVADRISLLPENQ